MKVQLCVKDLLTSGLLLELNPSRFNPDLPMMSASMPIPIQSCFLIPLMIGASADKVKVLNGLGVMAACLSEKMPLIL